jgi:hypothetical protein
MATHVATSYCDVRIRTCHKSTVHDFHLLSIPVHERHTGETIFNTFAKAMDALFPDWRETITGAFSDGEKKMTGRHQGVITRIHIVVLVLLIVRALSGLYPFRLDVQGVERTISTAILS